MQIRGFGAAGRFAVGLVAGYAVAVAALAALLIVLGGALAERTGANRQVYPSVGFSGVPVLADFGSDVSLDFLDDDLNLPRRFFSVRWRGFWYVPETHSRKGKRRVKCADPALKIVHDGDVPKRSRMSRSTARTSPSSLVIQASRSTG